MKKINIRSMALAVTVSFLLMTLGSVCRVRADEDLQRFRNRKLAQTTGLTPQVVPDRPEGSEPKDQSIGPSVQPPEGSYKCPETHYLNCMPPVPESARTMCTQEYIEWAKGHCPGFEVVY